jgi:lipopolysaccharide transport system ATP-binding protein
MEVRLAFSVAAHLNPQVLLVDEVLSVGDAAFQQMGLKKIREVSENGGTIIFISHNMTTIASLCNQAIVLESGKVAFPLGPVSDAISYYLSDVAQKQNTRLAESRQRTTPGNVEISGFNIRGADNMILETLTCGRPVYFEIKYKAVQYKPLNDITFSILIKTLKGDVIANLNSQDAVGPIKLSGTHGQITCSIASLPIKPGNISISLLIEQEGWLIDKIDDVFAGTVDGGGHADKHTGGEHPGWLAIEQDWSVM